MLAADTLTSPGSGTSRFSKVLPAPPAPTSRPPSKALPPPPLVLPQSLARKPVRKPVVTADKTLPDVLSPPQTPAKSPLPPPTPQPQTSLPALPPLPPLSVDTPLPPPPPPMSIPRRPVAPPKEVPAAPKPLPKLQTEHDKSASHSSEAGGVSPSDSLSSLLSAYSRSSAGDSVVKSSDGMASQRNSESTISPEAHEEAVKSWKTGKDSFAPLPTIPQESREVRPGQASNKLEPSALKDLPPPPPPPAPKDGPPPPTPKKDSIYVAKADAPVNIANASPPREQIWRRRSIRSDRSLQLPDLQLASLSHGSTAASQLPGPNTAPSTRNALGTATQSSQSSNAATTGATAWQPHPKAYISPVEEKQSPETASGSVTSPTSQPFKAYTPPAENSNSFEKAPSTAPVVSNHATAPQHQTSPPTDAMGSKTSKIRAQVSNFSLSKSRREDERPAPRDDTVVSPLEAPRLPTPEYRNQDAKPPLAETVVSPLSPAGPPTPPHDDTKPQPAPVQRKAVGAVALGGTPQPQPQQPIPNFAQAHAQPSPRTSSESHSPLPPPSVRDFGPLTPGYGPRPGSRAGSVAPSYAGSRPGSPASFGPRRGPGPGPGPGPRPYRPVITDFRELRVEDLPPPDPRALYFPKTVATPAAPDTVFKPFPLAASHVDCYTGHRIMKPSRNACYPLACQTCGLADRSERWACAACHVRVCSGCNRVLGSNGRSVPRLLEHLEAARQAGETSPTAQRGPSPHGLGLMAA